MINRVTTALTAILLLVGAAATPVQSMATATSEQLSRYSSPRLETDLLAIQADSPAQKAAVEERAAYGFDASKTTIQGLLGSTADVGSSQLGIVLTAEELVAVQDHLAIQSSVKAQTIEAIRALPGFGGAWYDHANGGELVVGVTHDLNRSQESILEVQPDFLGLGRLELVKHTRSDLIEAAGRASGAFSAVVPTGTLVSVSVDSSTNSVLLRVLPEDLSSALLAAPAIEGFLGVPPTISVGEVSQASACTSRSACTSPMKAGIQIRRGSKTGALCTMGFHVKSGSDDQYITSGHCDEGSADYFYHAGYTGNDCGGSGTAGCIGNRLATLLASYGKDIARFQMSNVQDSNAIYANAIAVSGWAWPVQNEGACSSLGNTGQWDCGTISDDYQLYDLQGSSGTWYYSLVGADHNGIAGIPGDSGSPIVRQANTGTALGIASTTGGAFALFGDAVGAWGIVPRT